MWDERGVVPVLQTLEYLRLPYQVYQDEAWLLCPFHEEQTPSCHVNVATGVWYCFGCGAGGAFEEFVLRVVGDPMSALVTIKRAQRLGGVRERLERRRDRDADGSDVVVRWRRMRRVDWTQAVLDPPGDMDGDVARYLRGRGYFMETLNAFDVRATGWDDYPFAVPVLEGEVLTGYVMRRLRDGPNKYLYNRGFDHEGGLFYYSTDDLQPCLVVEGVLDVMKAVQHGYRHVAALLGWRATPAKVAKLKAFGVTRVVCATDNTPTGEQGWAQMRESGLDVRRFRFPAHRKDVGELTYYEFVAGLPGKAEWSGAVEAVAR